MTADPFARLRPMLLAELRFTIESVSETHGELLRHELALLESDSAEVNITSGLLCLLTAEALGAAPEDALPAATSLALMSLMADVMTSLSREDGLSLTGAWGMPRALNAGDAFYALAQDALLKSSVFESDAERGLAAVGQLDSAARAHSEALYAGRANGLGPSRRVLGAAAVLGALAAGAEALAVEVVSGIAGLNEASADEIERWHRAGISSAAVEQLRAATKYIAEAAA